MLSRLTGLAEGKVKGLQAIAAIVAICTAFYSVFLKEKVAELLRPAPTKLECKVLDIQDADSPICDGKETRLLGPGTPGVTGIDAPEILHAKCTKEAALGLEARDFVRGLLPQLRAVEDMGVRDSYLRPMVRLRLRNGQLIDNLLIAKGLAVIWSPGYRPRWCDEIGSRDNDAN